MATSRRYYILFLNITIHTEAAIQKRQIQNRLHTCYEISNNSAV